MSLVNFLRVDGAGADVYSFKRNNLLYIPLQTSSQAYLTFLLFKERLESPTGDLDPLRSSLNLRVCMELRKVSKKGLYCLAMLCFLEILLNDCISHNHAN